MSFVASSVYTNLPSGPLPLMVDVGGSSQFSQCSFTHARIVGAGTVTFDTGQVITGVAAVETVAAIPANARSVVVAGTNLQLGRMD